MAATSIQTTIVNHVALDIAAPPDVVWRLILEEYVETKKFISQGHVPEPIDDLGALLGGYRIRLHKDGALIDDRICIITERDDEARRLSMYADYVIMPEPMQVFATYHAQSAGGGTRYSIDCHTRMNVEAPASGARGDFAAAVATLKTHFDNALLNYLQTVRERLEGAA